MKFHAIIVFACIGIILICISCEDSPPKNPINGKLNLPGSPPIAEKRAYISTHLNDSLTDNYFWMKDITRTDSDVIEYIEAENSYADIVLNNFKDIEDELFAEIVGRKKETDLNVPVKIDSFYYYSRTEEGKQYSISCRKKAGADIEEEILLILLDKNLLSMGKIILD